MNVMKISPTLQYFHGSDKNGPQAILVVFEHALSIKIGKVGVTVPAVKVVGQGIIVDFGIESKVGGQKKSGMEFRPTS